MGDQILLVLNLFVLNQEDSRLASLAIRPILRPHRPAVITIREREPSTYGLSHAGNNPRGAPFSPEPRYEPLHYSTNKPGGITQQSRPIEPGGVRPITRPTYRKPYPDWVNQAFPFPRGFKMPEFTLFTGTGDVSTIEHVGRFTIQAGEDAIDSGRLTFDSGKMKVDEDPFPKAANINIVVLTLLAEATSDDQRPVEQTPDVPKGKIVQTSTVDDFCPEDSPCMADPMMERLCVCCQRDIAVVWRFHEERAKRTGDPFAEVSEDPIRAPTIGPTVGRTFRLRVGRADVWATHEPRGQRNVPFAQLSRTQQRRAQRKYGQRMRASQRREKQEEAMAASTADDYEINTMEAHVVSSSADVSPIGREDGLERTSARSKSERWADQDSDEERPKLIQFGTFPPITVNHYLLPGEYKKSDENTSPLGSEEEQQALKNEDDEASLMFDFYVEPQLLCGKVSTAEKEGDQMGEQAVQEGQDDDLTDVEEEIDCP
ncbi:hypothetical protein Dimus_024442 [Dionaea muscipula]